MMFAAIGKRPTHALFVVVLVWLVTAAGLFKGEFSPSFRLYFDADSPELLSLNALDDAFSPQDHISFILHREGENLLDDAHMATIAQLSKHIWQLPNVRTVQSIVDYPFLLPKKDELTVVKLSDRSLTPADRKTLVMREPGILKLFVNANADTAYLVAMLSFKDHLYGSRQTYNAGVKLQETFGGEAAGLYLSGTVLANESLIDAVFHDVIFIFPLVFFAIFAVLWIITRSIPTLLCSMLIMTLTITSTFGVFAWLDHIFTPVAGSAPTAIAIIIVAQVVHLWVAYLRLNETLPAREAAIIALEKLWFPLVMTSLTTVVGMMGLNFSDAPPYRDLGNMVALGCLLALFYTVMTLLIYASWQAGTVHTATHKYLQNVLALQQWVNFVDKRPKSVIAATLLLCALPSIGVLNLRLEDQWTEYFSEAYPIKRALNLESEQLKSGNFIQYKLDIAPNYDLFDRQFVTQLLAFSRWLESHQRVDYVAGFHHVFDILLSLDPPTSLDQATREELAQRFMLYEMALPTGAQHEDFMSFDQRSLKITLSIKPMTSKNVMALADEIKAEASRYDALLLGKPTGLDYSFAVMGQRNLSSIFLGTFVCFIVISLMMGFIFKNTTVALISLVPNLLPACMAYGTWGLMGNNVDLAVSIIGCLTMGIIVDDTIHIISAFRYHMKKGQTALQAMRYTMNETGVAVVSTSVIIAGGFFLLGLSDLGPVSDMGVLVGMTVISALFTDLVLLPAVLLLVYGHTCSRSASGRDGELVREITT